MSVFVTGCCPFHMIAAGGYTVGRFRCEAVGAEGQPLSFSDSTPKTVSQHCLSTMDVARDLITAPNAARVTWIKGATVIPMTGPERLPNHDVAIRGDRIIAVVPSGSASFDDAIVIDGMGKFVMPGLADMHAHAFIRTWAQTFTARFESCPEPERFTLPAGLMMFQYLAAGVTRIDIMAGDPDMRHIRDETRAGRFYGPVMRVGSPIIDGPQPIQSPLMSWLVSDAEGGRTAARMIAQERFDFAKPYNNLPAEAYHALMDECAALGIPVLGHIPTAIGVEPAIQAGRQSVAHVAELFQWMSDPERSDPARLERMAKRLADTGQWLQVTIAVIAHAEAVFSKGAVQADYPDTAFCNPLVNKVFHPNSPAMKAIANMPHLAVMLKDALALSILTTRLLKQAGANLVTGTDAPNPFLAEGYSIHEELEMLTTHCGFTPLEALKLVTCNAARQQGEGDAGGVIAQGAFADLLMLDADPLTDIRATRRIGGVFARGAFVSREAIASGNQRILNAFAAMPVPA
jgi:imidazolonepropionase-like amidohydrolase